MGVKFSEEFEAGLVVQEEKPKLKAPSMYKVVLYNDDYTPMDFVVEVLKHFFAMNQEKAVQVMLQVHATGKAICGIYTYGIAETKVVQVNNYSKNHDHPLLCGMEAA